MTPDWTTCPLTFRARPTLVIDPQLLRLCFPIYSAETSSRTLFYPSSYENESDINKESFFLLFFSLRLYIYSGPSTNRLFWYWLDEKLLLSADGNVYRWKVNWILLNQWKRVRNIETGSRASVEIGKRKVAAAIKRHRHLVSIRCRRNWYNRSRQPRCLTWISFSGFCLLYIAFDELVFIVWSTRRLSIFIRTLGDAPKFAALQPTNLPNLFHSLLVSLFYCYSFIFWLGIVSEEDKNGRTKFTD